MKNFVYAFKSLKMVIKKYPLYIIGEIFSMLCMVVQTLIPIKIVDLIVQGFTNNDDFKKIAIEVIIYVAIILVVTVVNLIISFLFNYVERNFTVYLATSLFRKLDCIDYDFHENPNFLDNYTRALEEGANHIYNASKSLIDLVKTIFQSLSIFAVIMLINPLAVVYAIVIGFVFILIRLKTSKMSFNLQTMLRPLFRKRSYVGRVFFVKDYIADIKTTDISDCLLEKHENVGDELVKTHKDISIKKSWLFFASSILVNSIYPVILGIVAYATLDNLEISSLASLTVAASSLSTLVTSFVGKIAYIQNYAIECKVPFDVLDMKSKIEGIEKEEIKDEFKELNISHIYFKYQEDYILKDVTLNVSKGQKIAIVGANGAGKTTLVKLLLRLYDVNEGSISYNDLEYSNITPSSLRKRVGAVFQNSEVYSVTVAENVLLRKVENEDDENLVIDALKFSGLYDYVMTLEDGINTMVTREFHNRGTIFSGGQIQKLAVSRGYAQNYELFILDEPSSALDPIAETEMYHNMLKLGRDKTIIFISHRLSATANVDKIYLFNNGQIEEEGTHDELMQKKNGLYRQMFISQSEKYLGGEE